MQVCKKSSQERPLAVAKYSDRSQAPDATHAVLTDTEFKSAADPDKIVRAEERVKAYKVCRNIIGSMSNLTVLPSKHSISPGNCPDRTACAISNASTHGG